MRTYTLKRKLPIYINTLNIFRVYKTWYVNRNKFKRPKIRIQTFKSDFWYLTKRLYTWYWWDHSEMYNFEHKKILILIDDVFYKYVYGIKMMEQVPFILIRIFNYNIIFKFKSPDLRDDYQYWETMK